MSHTTAAGAVSPPTVRILGTHGIPAAYGGFETAAENVALYLHAHGWRVVVYCQEQGVGPMREDVWRGIERVIVPVDRDGWLGTSTFDWITVRHAARHRDVCLTFGYNTAIFNVLQRIRGIPNVINMDGIEWSRARWGKLRQAILYTNERIACAVGDHLIADHPCINDYLERKAPARKISTITYGAHRVSEASTEPVLDMGLTPGNYLTLICRPIPENSILELVQAFSAKSRGHQLAIFGNYTPDTDPYHRAVMDAASDEVRFVGAIYEPAQVAALRLHSAIYLHGHTVGGTNPSLVEAMAVGNPVVAHDNPYNRWVAGDGALYFDDVESASSCITELLDSADLRESLSAASRARHAREFTWEHVAGQYEAVLRQFATSHDRSARTRAGVGT
ncbi:MULTISPECIES: DUF1972 domain-containing protein [Allobranchiibius]|uniref:Glycosyltransferase involved in cell wall biosynthesis n=1 Tax=Allobranchiibius huperziae TaxID=1874116 RepID=A0A853DD91_9MICO|nr:MULTISPECIES: DUF1972 domain-containing protein [Allobranchiibius]NYJ75536.1 glycosyltransferase involved in cell wall biosynthesis [Allobranchiibius huperziae]UIJ36281.1 DUF1972 domain-containing protein [Allobranchiibius sp. GilTou73]